MVLVQGNEHLTHLRTAVKQQAQEFGFDREVHSFVQEVTQTGRHVSQDVVLAWAQESGIIQQLVDSFRPTKQELAGELVRQQQALQLLGVRSKVMLLLKVKAARAFTQYLAAAPPGAQLMLVLELFGQRWELGPSPCHPEPNFSAQLLFELPGSGASPATDALLSCRQLLHVAAVQTLPASNTQFVHLSDATPEQRAALTLQGSSRSLVGLALADWRKVLTGEQGRASVIVELSPAPGQGAQFRGPGKVGVLELSLELHPAPQRMCQEGELLSQQRLERAVDADVLAMFISRARDWWGDYVRPNSSLRQRFVKVLATAQDGVQRPVCSFVQPLQLGRQLCSPYEAARFVSLLAVREGASGLDQALPGTQDEADECWCWAPTVLAAKGGSKEELALLLCGLLLGFGMDAWVVVGGVGVEGQGPGTGAAWVLTRMPNGVTFWDPATGGRSEAHEAPMHGYRSVGCVFNHQRLYANRQPHDVLPVTSYAFEDVNLWAELPLAPQDVPGPWWALGPLRSLNLDAYTLEAQLEDGLRSALNLHRTEALALQPTSWDDGLAHLMMPALAAYEQEAVTGHATSSSAAVDFQQAIRRAVPNGWVFKGLPQHQRVVDPAAVLQGLLHDTAIRDILATDALTAKFALRCRVTVYPEDIVSVWIMLAVKYQPVR